MPRYDLHAHVRPDAHVAGLRLPDCRAFPLPRRFAGLALLPLPGVEDALAELVPRFAQVAA